MEQIPNREIRESTLTGDDVQAFNSGVRSAPTRLYSREML